MKAWFVKEKGSDYATVVFAETRGRAKSIALLTDTCDGAEFCSIEASRMPQMDKYYVNGKQEMGWEIPDDRVALVRDGGFYCVDREDCLQCTATQYCGRYTSSEEERE